MRPAQQQAGEDQAEPGERQRRLQAAGEMRAERRQQRAEQLAEGETGGQLAGVALRRMRRQFAGVLHHQLHAGEERQAGQHYPQGQPADPRQQAGEHAEGL